MAVLGDGAAGDSPGEGGRRAARSAMWWGVLMDNTQVLIVSATAAEAAHVPEGFEVVITGVGKVAAATEVTAALAARAAAGTLAGLRVVNIGTAGALRDGLSGLFEIGRVINHDLSAEAIRALGFEVTDELTLSGGDIAPDTTLATGDLFVSDPDVRVALAARAHLVDMEGYAVAWACARFGVECVLVKHVSDNADETALDWVDAVDASARDLAAWLQNWLG